MNYIVSLFIAFLLIFSSFGQSSESLIPYQSSNVFTFNNVSLFKKISINDLVNYEFMEELQTEYFDGSTNLFSLDKIGIDLNSKLNIFFGKSDDFIISGSTFNIIDSTSLFEAFDDYEFQKTYKNARIYSSLFNHLIVYEKTGLIIRTEPTDIYLNRLCDSIWYSRGFMDPFYDYNSIEYESIDESIFDENASNNIVYPDASEDPISKNYFELRDSLAFEIMSKKFESILDEIILMNKSLLSTNSNFKKLMSHNADGLLFINNQREFQNNSKNWFFQLFSEDFDMYIKELYKNNVILGDLNLNGDSIVFDLKLLYNNDMGRIYSKMSNNKFDKKILKYLPSNSTGFFNYHIDLQKTYEEIYNVLFPILQKEPNPDIYSNVLILDFIHEFLDENKFFKAFDGNLFGHFQGIKKVPIDKIEFVYDEDNFEYSEVKNTILQEVPTLSVGMICKKNEIAKKFLNRMVKLIPDFELMNNVYVWKNKILNSLPLYIYPSTDAILVSNDKEFIDKLISKGEKNAFNRKKYKDLLANKFLYLNLDFNETLDFFPLNFLPSVKNDFINPLKGNSGNLIVKTINSDELSTELQLNYTYPNNQNNYTHFLDLVNAFYIISKK